MTYDELKARNTQLTHLLAKCEDPKEGHKLKRELYSNKVKMLDMIHEDDKARAGITAREFMANVKAMPELIKFETGIGALDHEFLGGLQTGLLVQLAGESGVGKTKLLLEITCNVAKKHKATFFNFEMGHRLLANRLQNRNLCKDQQQNLYIDSDTRNLKDLIMEIELYVKDGFKFFMIDSKMKIKVDGAGPTHEKISQLSNELAQLTQQRDILIVLINQMNESDIKEKRLALKGSGDQKYDSDIALFYVKDDDGKRRLICTKNRQDEREFSLDLWLDDKGNTVGKYTPTYNAGPEIIEYVSDMPLLD